MLETLTLKHFEHTIEIRAARADKAHVFDYQLILLIFCFASDCLDYFEFD